MKEYELYTKLTSLWQSDITTIIETFDKYGCHVPLKKENRRDFCWCSKPFCYKCIGNRISMVIFEKLKPCIKPHLQTHSDKPTQ
jgi:hypothetical protein